MIKNNEMMEYKGYMGKVFYDVQADIFHGDVIGLKDVITFQGTSVKKLKQAFKDSINDYLAWCKECGEVPLKFINYRKPLKCLRQKLKSYGS